MSTVESETLRLLCEAPLTTVAELSSLTDMPATTLRERLVRMAKRGLIDSRPHRLAMLGERPQRRFFPTEAGIIAFAGGETHIQRVLQRYPVSKHWFRLFAESLDAVAVLYAFAAMIGDFEAAAGRSRVRVEHGRSGPYDMLVRVSSGCTIGVVRQGPMLTAASLRYRLRTIERLGVRVRPMVTLVLTDSEQDMRRALRAIADPHDHQQTFVAVTGEIIAGKGESEVWQQGGYGFAATPTVMPNVTLSAIVSRVHRSPDAFRRLYVGSGRHPKEDVRAGLPEPAEQLEQALAIALSRAEKRVLDLLADWPFCSPQQLAGLLGGVGVHRSNEVLRSLRELGLVQREPYGYLLSDHGLTYLARRDRAAVGPMLDRWTPQQAEDGTYIGIALRVIASQ